MGNRGRDARVEFELQSLRWHVVTICACTLKTEETRKWLKRMLREWLGSVECEEVTLSKESFLRENRAFFPTATCSGPRHRVKP